MKSPLSDKSNNSNVNNFNAGIFKYLLFVATNGGGTERNRSKIGKDLKAWMKNKNPDRSTLTTDWIKIKALNCVINFPWSVTKKDKWA